MSTVTLSQPHWAMTSAANPDGIASQPLTAALPACQRSFNLLSAIPISFFDHRRRGPAAVADGVNPPAGRVRDGRAYQEYRPAVRVMPGAASGARAATR